MDVDLSRLYWGATTLFGLSLLVDALAGGVTDATVWTWLTAVGGVVIVAVSAFALASDEIGAENSPSSSPLTYLVIVGSVVYAAVTLLELL